MNYEHIRLIFPAVYGEAGCLAGVEGALTVMGVPIGREGLHRAVEVLARAATPSV